MPMHFENTYLKIGYPLLSPLVCSYYPYQNSCSCNSPIVRHNHLHITWHQVSCDDWCKDIPTAFDLTGAHSGWKYAAFHASLIENFPSLNGEWLGILLPDWIANTRPGSSYVRPSNANSPFRSGPRDWLGHRGCWWSASRPWNSAGCPLCTCRLGEWDDMIHQVGLWDINSESSNQLSWDISHNWYPIHHNWLWFTGGMGAVTKTFDVCFIGYQLLKTGSSADSTSKKWFPTTGQYAQIWLRPLIQPLLILDSCSGRQQHVTLASLGSSRFHPTKVVSQFVRYVRYVCLLQ